MRQIDVQAAYEAARPQRPGGPGSGQRPPTSPDPQDVADAIMRLIETPAGERPLRTVVGSMFTAGVEALNQAYEGSKKQIWDSIGMSTY